MPNTLKALDGQSFFSFPLSKNISKTKAGFLVCENVKVARTGIQYYAGGREMQVSGFEGKQIKAYRLPEDVFEKDSLASYEGAPVTDNHTEWVTPENYSRYLKGHFQNVRRVGKSVVGDLVINDPELIAKVEAGTKREISAGYDYSWERYKDGVRVFNIRVNHIAVVTEGRAGPDHRIIDSIDDFRSKRTVSKRQKALDYAAHALAQLHDADECREILQALDSAPEKKASLFGGLFGFEGPQTKAVDDIGSHPEIVKMKDSLATLNQGMAEIVGYLKAKDADEDEDEKAKDKKKAKDADMDGDVSDKKAKDEDGDEDEDDKAKDKKKAKDEDVQIENPINDAMSDLVKELKPFLTHLPEHKAKDMKAVLGRALDRKTGESAFGAIQEIIRDKANKTHNGSVGDAIAENPEQYGEDLMRFGNPDFFQGSTWKGEKKPIWEQ